MIGAGRRRERITIQRVELTDDGAGGATREWIELATRWAEVLPTGGREALTSVGAVRGVQGYKITIRHGVVVRPEDRIVWRDVVMNVRSAADPDGKRADYVIFAEAGGAA